MLTKAEHKWLKKRPDYLDLTVSPYAPVYRMWARNSVWRLLLYDIDFIGEKTKVINEAGAFESLVIKYLATHEQHAPCITCSKLFSVNRCPEAWCLVKDARLKVEEEMENEQQGKVE